VLHPDGVHGRPHVADGVLLDEDGSEDEVGPDIWNCDVEIRLSVLVYEVVPFSLAAFQQTMGNSSSYLRTEEAIADYLDALSPDGLLVMQTFNMVELRSLIEHGAKRFGIADLESHTLFAESSSVSARYSFAFKTASLLVVSRRPFTHDERAAAKGWIARQSGVAAEKWSCASWRELRERHPKESAFTDDFPYFGFMSAGEYLHGGGGYLQIDLLARGLEIAGNAIVLVLVLVLVPLATSRKRADKFTRADILSLGYFFSVGVGFMFFEIPLMDRLVLFMGSPTRSIAVCLALLLVGTGVGSIAGRRLLYDSEGALVPRRMAVALSILLVLLGGVALRMNGFLVAIVRSSSIVQYAAIGSTLFLLGCVLGVPFPQGISALRHRNPSLIPWAWGINGAASVMAINVVGLLLGSVNNSRFFLVGVASYAVACALWIFVLSARPPRATA
jgi:hypothetical protein